jgi:type I restriction enzyme M protein
MSINILQYEKDVWKTADLLIASGIKQSDFPKYMMPFFALLMVESRLVREAKRLKEEIGDIEIEDFIDMFQLEGLGYNDFVIRKNKTLKDICKNDKSFDVDFHAYLKAFDAETKYLLGVDKGTEEEKFLDISGISGLLKKKRILFETVQAWSEIDLTPFNNSEITTLEEHIKRKWADISAETAGEQYTPDDIIYLISDIISSKIVDNENFLTIYDPTCGGGNLLFGVEDKIKEKFKRPTKTFGEDWNDSLYALAKIESRFRTDSDIRYGNTLTNISFIEKKFDVIVANPPYGISWDGYKNDIYNDTTERFVALPNISDGQLLFAQHNLFHLSNEGIGVVVHNGSALSGDAKSGEIAIRKYIFDNDWVEAIIQLPTDEFFNTNIYTYLWIFNKNKPLERKDKLMLINASDLFVPLTKSKGKKRKKISSKNRKEIVNALLNFKNNEFAKVFDKWDFYYNKQSIQLTNVDIYGNSVEMPKKLNKLGELVEEKSIKLDFKEITIISKKIDNSNNSIFSKEISDYDTKQYKSLFEYYDKYFKIHLSNFNYKDESFYLIDNNNNKYSFDNEKESIKVVDINDNVDFLGNGKIIINCTYKKASKSKKEVIQISAEIIKDLQKDTEYINYNPDKEENKKLITESLQKNVTRPYILLENIIGVEIFFNKVFQKPIVLRDINIINEDISSIDENFSKINQDIINSILTGINKNVKLKDSGISWLGKIPIHWEVKRFKDVCKNYTTGGTPSTSNPYYFEGDNTWVTIGDINDSKYVENSNLKLTDEAIKSANIPLTPKGSLIYSFKLTLGKIAFANKDLYTNEALLSIFPNNKVDLNYYYYMLPIFLLLNATENIYGAKMLNQRFIANALILNPPLDEQKMIAEYIESKINDIDVLINKLEQNVNLLKEAKKTLINDVVIGQLRIL